MRRNGVAELLLPGAGERRLAERVPVGLRGAPCYFTHPSPAPGSGPAL